MKDNNVRGVWVRVSGREKLLCMDLSCIIHLRVTNLYSDLNYMKKKQKTPVLDNQKKKEKSEIWIANSSYRFDRKVVDLKL